MGIGAEIYRNKTESVSLCVFLSRYASTALGVCLGSLSYWKMEQSPISFPNCIAVQNLIIRFIFCKQFFLGLPLVLLFLYPTCSILHTCREWSNNYLCHFPCICTNNLKTLKKNILCNIFWSWQVLEFILCCCIYVKWSSQIKAGTGVPLVVRQPHYIHALTLYTLYD